MGPYGGWLEGAGLAGMCWAGVCWAEGAAALAGLARTAPRDATAAMRLLARETGMAAGLHAPPHPVLSVQCASAVAPVGFASSRVSGSARKKLPAISISTSL